jgi:hypothetical protein
MHNMKIFDENVQNLILDCPATYLEHLNERSGPRLQEFRVIVDAVEVISSQVVGSLRHFVENGPRLLQVILHLDKLDSHPKPDVPGNTLPTTLGPMCVCMCVSHKVHLLSHTPAQCPDAYAYLDPVLYCLKTGWRVVEWVALVVPDHHSIVIAALGR